MSSLEFYNGKPLAEQVADYILNYIIDNNLEVGAKIPNEFELGKMINVSRTTIREAIKLSLIHICMEASAPSCHLSYCMPSALSDPRSVVVCMAVQQIQDGILFIRSRLRLPPPFFRKKNGQR